MDGSRSVAALDRCLRFASDRRTLVGLCLLLAVASLIPIPGGGSPGIGILTAAGHVLGYGALGALLVVYRRDHPRPVLVAIALATGFGFAIEIAQIAVPTRGFAWIDVVLNAVGATLGSLVVAVSVGVDAADRRHAKRL